MPRKVYGEREKTGSHSESDIASLVRDGTQSQRESIDDSSESSSYALESELQAYSDTDSSTEVSYQCFQLLSAWFNVLTKINCPPEDVKLRTRKDRN